MRAMVLALVATAAASDAAATCVPDLQAIESASTQDTLVLRDATLPASWRRAVERVRQPDGTERLRMRTGRTPPQRGNPTHEDGYSSIQPVALGGTSLGYQLFRGGCGELRGPGGEALPLPLFMRAEGVPLPGDASAAVLLMQDDDSRRYARFERGRLTAVSRDYAQRFVANTLTLGTSAVRHAVATGPENGHGLLDLRTLQEVLAPQWRGVGEVVLDGDHAFVVADDGRMKTVFSADGRTRLLEGLSALKPIYGGWLSRGGADAVAVAAWLDDGRCQLYGRDWRPLLPWPVPATREHCPSGRNDPGGPHIVADGPDGRTHVLAKQPGGVREVAVLEGALVALARGAIITKTNVGGSARFRVWSARGEALNGRDFEDVRPSGCGIYEVLDGGTWKQLTAAGEVTERRGYPFSC